MQNDSKKNVKKIVIILLIAIVVALFFIFDLKQYLTLSYIKNSQESFRRLYAANQITVIAIYMLIYIVVTALSLPGAAMMTLLGGGMFGLITGTVVVSFASTIGATIACVVSRYLLGSWVQANFPDKLKVINRGVENEGAFYLFTLRLIPAFPFFAINLAMGLTKMPVRTYYIISQLGMLPGTIVFVNAGKELAKIESLKGLMSPSLIISFAILGIFPIAIKKIMGLVRPATPIESENVSDEPE